MEVGILTLRVLLAGHHHRTARRHLHLAVLHGGTGAVRHRHLLPAELRHAHWHLTHLATESHLGLSETWRALHGTVGPELHPWVERRVLTVRWLLIEWRSL